MLVLQHQSEIKKKTDFPEKDLSDLESKLHVYSELKERNDSC